MEIVAEDKKFLNMGPFDMSREVAWASELKIGGRKVDSEAIGVAKKWGMNFKDVEHCFRGLKLTPGVAPKAWNMLEGSRSGLVVQYDIASAVYKDQKYWHLQCSHLCQNLLDQHWSSRTAHLVTKWSFERG